MTRSYKILYCEDPNWCGDFDCCSPCHNWCVYETINNEDVILGSFSDSEDAENFILKENQIEVVWK